MEGSVDAADESASTVPQRSAPSRELPTVHFHSIEYPGYVRPESLGKAIDTLGGQSSIERAFRRNAPKEDSLLELNLRPDNPFSHPLPGDLVPTNNILLRVVKRRLKRPPPKEGDHDDDSQQAVVGEYTAVAVGVIPKTARFRSEPSSPLSTPRGTPRAEAVLIEVWPTSSTNPLKMIPSPNFAGQ
jgi:general transcription factor 3C polypeptide 5 (transcription factor C subunit 1)